ncbi:hypothetical protein [Microcystis aeruginosa]|uniref:Uncharacterized protein n=1 Tax=Microcystis aeruginosa PCC 9808 TaxID=1160284 RepID=I4HRH4_MICAE|nr:hypothetical protein [Microcystis aeruginosa]CCI24648.1 hypothetical protein MICAG_2500012 [Microcystis aeruginosa PCC 9808]
MPDKDKQFKNDVRESSGYSLSVPYWRYKELEEQYSELLMRVDADSPECLSLADSLEKEKSLERGIAPTLED